MTAAPPPFEPSEWLQRHPLAHWLFDLASLRLLWANDAAASRYGYAISELLTLTRDALLVPDEVPRAHAFMAALPASLQRQPVWRERRKDGSELLADWRGVTVSWQGRPARLLTVMDAAVREQATREADRSRELLQVAGRIAHIGGWLLDLRQGVVSWSDEVCALHEVPPGSTSALHPAVRFYPPGAAEQIEAALARCIETGAPMDLELPFVGARGTERWVRVVGEAVRDATGRVVAVQGAQQDVSATRRDTLALAESREQLAALIAAIPDLWMVYDRDSRYLQVSDPQHPGLSAPWGDKLGRRIDETVSPELAGELVRLSAEAHRTGQPQSHHYELQVAGGSRRRFEARYVAMSGGRTLSLIRDVTETYELERRFEQMADAAPIGIFIADASGSVTYANPAWRALYGLPADDALGRRWATVVHPEDLPRLVAGWQAYVAGQPLFECEFRLRPLDGAPERIFWAQARPLALRGGQVISHVGAIVDVTPARELQQEREARAVAEEAGRRQNVFLSRVSHELRTPLNAILGFGELLRDDLAADPRAATYLGHMVQAGRHMLALVDDLLELQRIEQGRFRPTLVTLSAAGLLESCAQMLAPMSHAAGIVLDTQADTTLTLASDERGLRQVLLNLGSNAIKYGRAGGHVTLACTADDEHGLLRFTVSDDGPGMSEQQLQRLFHPFERLGQEAGSVGGSGLGLLISRQLAEALGGSLDISSRPGAGTVATLTVPRQASA
jgi:PAS domain S-box-containing protein